MDERIEDIIPSDEIDQSEKTIKNDEYNSLSKEAKDLIRIILNTPNEIISLLPTNRSKTSKLTKNKCKLYLILKWKSSYISKMITKNLAIEVIEEITRWVKNL